MLREENNLIGNFEEMERKMNVDKENLKNLSDNQV